MVKSEEADVLPFMCLSVQPKFSLFLWSFCPFRFSRCSKYDRFCELINILEFRKFCECGESRGLLGLLVVRALKSGDVVSTIAGLPFDELLSSDKWYSVLMLKPLSGIKCDFMDANLDGCCTSFLCTSQDSTSRDFSICVWVVNDSTFYRPREKIFTTDTNELNIKSEWKAEENRHTAAHFPSSALLINFLSVRIQTHTQSSPWFMRTSQQIVAMMVEDRLDFVFTCCWWLCMQNVD